MSRLPISPIADKLSLPPLYVDLDGSLIKVDLLHEAMARLGLRSPLLLMRISLKHRESLAAFKTEIAKEVSVDPATLPYETAVISRLREEAALGRRLILATASPLAWAEPIAAYLGFFSNIIATNANNNLKSRAKLAAIQDLMGASPFAYLGNSSDDIPLFEASSGGRMLVGSSSKPLSYLRKADMEFEHIAPSNALSQIWNAILACRPVHWIKNSLIFVPAVTGWGMYDPIRLIPAIFAFIAFSLVASAVYLINDLADLAPDRGHPDKRHRPLAAGKLSVTRGAALAALLAVSGLGIAIAAGPIVITVLMVYVALNAAYTARLKEMPLTDIALLCAFYLIRVILGLAILGLPQSIWFIAFLGCLFAELALWKRYVEVISAPATSSKRRSYAATDANVLLAFGVGFSFSAAIVLTHYLQSPEVSPIYQAPRLLALLAPILLLHNLGMWLEASRGEGASDPITYILKSRKFWCMAVVAMAVLLAARFLPT
jgi:4-hydroxybenzoate polyprenyltransferase/phosphoserine phosphatase